MSDERAQILARVRDALTPLPHRAALPDWEQALIRLRAAQPAADLWVQFFQRFSAVNGTPLKSAAELVALLDKGGWRRGHSDVPRRDRLRPHAARRV